MKKALLAILFCFIIGPALCQTNGDYRSRASGSWNQYSTWEVYNDGWQLVNSVAAGPYTNVIPSHASGDIGIYHAVLVNVNTGMNETTIYSGGNLIIAQGKTVKLVGGTLETPIYIQINGRLTNNGTLDLTPLSALPCIIDGTLASNATILSSNPSIILFNDGSKYQHFNYSGGNIPMATWATNSNCQIYGLRATDPSPPNNLNQTFGNFLWDTPNMGATGTFTLFGQLTSIAGSLTIRSTGTTPQQVRLDNAGTGSNLSIGENLEMEGGILTLSQNQTTATTISIGGDIIMTGGVLRLGNSNNQDLNIFLSGNFEKTGGTIERGTGSGAGTIRFSGSSHTYANNANITSAVGFSVENGSTLNLGSSFLSGTGAFTLFSGGTLNVGSTDVGGAIQSGNTGGNIRMTGVRTYQSGSTVVYNGLAAQFMGNGQPAPPSTIIDNLNGVTLVSNVTIGNFTIANGTFDLGANNTVRINGNFVVNDTFDAQQGLARFGGAAPQTISGTSDLTFFNFELNQTVNSTLDIATNVSIENNLSINSGSTLNAGNQLLTLMSTPTRTANVNSLATIGASIVGTVIVQRHMPKAESSRKSFHFMASPVTDAQFTDWTADESTAEIYRYQEPIRDYVRVTNLSNTIQNGRGYSVFIDETGSFDMDTRGTLKQGNIDIPLTSQDPDVESPDGWNLIGNPYPSAIAWDNITLPAGVYDAVYTTDNFNNSGQETGAKTTYSVAYVDGVGTPSGYSGTIAQGQSFWVKAIAPTETLTITESAKISATNTQFYREGGIPNVLRVTLNGEEVKDETVVRLREGATDGFDGKYDAYKFLKGDISIATLTSDNVQAVINAFGTQECDRVIPLVGEGFIKGSYALDFAGMESFDKGINIALRDLFENQTIDIRNRQTYTFQVTDENADSFSSRFEIIIGNSTANTELLAIGETLCEDKTVAIVTIEKSEPGIQYSAEWKGKIISESLTGTGSALQLFVNTSQLDLGENALTIRAQSGNCSMAALTEKPVVTKIKKSEITVVQTGNICNSGTATLIASGAMENGWYHWYEDENSSEPIAGQQSAEFITPYLTKTKTYYVAAVNAAGCEGNRVQVSANVSHMEMDQVVLTEEGSTLVSSAQENNQWYFNDELLVNETSNRLEASVSGMYTVMVTQGNCTLTASKEISLSEEDGLLDADLNIYPNPTQHKLFIKVKTTNSNVSATMVNASGIQMESKMLIGENGVKETEFDLLPYASGIYNVRIVDGHKIFIKKIVKIK